VTREAKACSACRQGGWVGLVAVLLALVIVALLAKDALKGYGLLGGAGGPAGAPSRAERAIGPGAQSGIVHQGGAPQAPPTAIERARAVEGTLQQQADERAGRIDEETK